MTHTTEASAAPRDLEVELLALHGATIDRGYDEKSGSDWRTAQMPDQAMRIEVQAWLIDHHMTTRSNARQIASAQGYTLGRHIMTAHLIGPDGLPQTRRVYELTFAE